MKIPSIFRNPIITPLDKMDISNSGIFSILPYDMIIEIFSCLGAREFLIVPRVNRHFYTLCQNQTLIKKIFLSSVPMAADAPSLYEKIGYKTLLTGKGWPLLFAPPRVVIPRYEKVLILCHQISKAWRANKNQKATGISIFFTASAYIFNKVYKPLVIQKAHRAIKEFQKHAANDLAMIEQLKNSLEIQNPTQKRKTAESMIYVLLKHKIQVSDVQFKANPRWTVAGNSINVRKKPCLSNWRIPASPKGGTLLTAKPFSENERKSRLEELNSTLKKQVQGIKEVLDTQLTSHYAQNPWYKRIANTFLLSIGMLGFCIGFALVVHKIYQLIKLLIMLYYFAKSALYRT